MYAHNLQHSNFNLMMFLRNLSTDKMIIKLNIVYIFNIFYYITGIGALKIST